MNKDGILLLGGAGFIGNALATRLKQASVPVHIVGRHNVGQLEQLMPQCSMVIHLASETTPGSSARQAGLELGNLTLTLRLLDELRAQPQIHLIYFSSGGTVYGNPEHLPVTESSPIAPLSNYGAGKAAQESFCQALRAQGHAVTILRPSNAYGPGQTMKNGFGLVRTMLEHARLGTAVEIWGDGENVRDFIYIDDIVEATLRVIAQPQDCGTYNLGSGAGYSVNQVRGMVEQVCGQTLPTTYRSARGLDVRSVVLDNTRFIECMGWQPTVGFADGVARTWEWLQRA
ncbi:MAG: NAD-dependent epimerase/dehydratase family protein [Rhodoferax sp.]|nr:NAD-dependent epimerase/dehydratase family protein [Rhodoferax sp.]